MSKLARLWHRYRVIQIPRHMETTCIIRECAIFMFMRFIDIAHDNNVLEALFTCIVC